MDGLNGCLTPEWTDVWERKGERVDLGGLILGAGRTNNKKNKKLEQLEKVSKSKKKLRKVRKCFKTLVCTYEGADK